MGPAEIYRACQEPAHGPAIRCHSRDDVDLPLLPDTRLRRAWRTDQFPSGVREDTLPTHDYLSITVEFDNGQDITDFWSAELPVGTGFRCPTPRP